MMGATWANHYVCFAALHALMGPQIEENILKLNKAMQKHTGDTGQPVFSEKRMIMKLLEGLKFIKPAHTVADTWLPEAPAPL